MAQRSVAEHGLNIRLACAAFSISVTCYRYQPRLSDENAEIADWLLRLTDTHRRWGFGLCFLYLRNVKGFRWNHKRVYRIYRELELNLRIKPRKRLRREMPEKLAKPETVNHVWSMDFVRHEAPCKRAQVRGLRPLAVAAAGEKLRAARSWRCRDRVDSSPDNAVTGWHC
jgi:putative transposase|tara:strand:+ start:174 stop:683 length:510 start_codon:yes stop_codon:yes gene_type:complete